MSDRLGERELDVMVALWRHGPGTVADVQGRLGVELAYNTVSTILRNLEAKGFVDHTADRRLFSYFARMSEQAARGNALSRVVDKLFRGSPLGVVTHMVENENLSHQDLQELHEFLDQRLTCTPENADVKKPPRSGSRRKES